VLHDKLKHIEIWYHYIHDMVQRGFVKLQYVCIDEQVADVLTKPLSSETSLVLSERTALERGSDVDDTMVF